MLASAEEFAARIMAGFDDYIAAQRLDAPEPEDRDRGPTPIDDVTELDLQAHGISTIVWSTGYRPDYRWIQFDVTDEYGLPDQTRGVSRHQGLYFVGVNWLHKRKSALFCGVGEDAEHVVSHLVARTG
jgi:putative flavoprotein involved in K+ transport